MNLIFWKNFNITFLKCIFRHQVQRQQEKLYYKKNHKSRMQLTPQAPHVLDSFARNSYRHSETLYRCHGDVTPVTAETLCAFCDRGVNKPSLVKFWTFILLSHYSHTSSALSGQFYWSTLHLFASLTSHCRHSWLHSTILILPKHFI